MTHADLRMLYDKELYHELSESKKLLEDITGIPVRTISFPFGSLNKRVWEHAKKCGYEAAVAYRNHKQAKLPIFPITGVYKFDTVEDIIEKIEQRQTFSNARARSAVMPHFAKGTAVWKFRKTYSVFNVFR
jgi:peptidoglycan/xylan/chitin deacetylase (PgdA/CDA1 family)